MRDFAFLLAGLTPDRKRHRSQPCLGNGLRAFGTVTVPAGVEPLQRLRNTGEHRGLDLQQGEIHPNLDVFVRGIQRIANVTGTAETARSDPFLDVALKLVLTVHEQLPQCGSAIEFCPGHEDSSNWESHAGRAGPVRLFLTRQMYMHLKGRIGPEMAQ